MANALRKNKIDDERADGHDQEKNISSRSLFDLEKELADAVSEFGADHCDQEPRCLEVKREIELYKAECDNAGAFKFKRFEREMAEIFAADPRELTKKRYVFVAMGELDRLNAEGRSHSAGDAGLEATVSVIKAVCDKVLGADRGDEAVVFRYGGNEFLLELDRATVDEIRLIEAGIVNAEFRVKNYEGVESPPLSVFSTSPDEVIEIVKSVEGTSFDGATQDPIDLAAKVVDGVRRVADFNLSIASFATRIDRVIAKLASGQPNARAEARAFYDNYLQKGFHGKSLDTFEAVESLWNGGEDQTDMKRALDLLAVESARRQFAADRQAQLYEAHLVNVKILELSRYLEEKTGVETVRQEALVSDQKLATIPALTRGSGDIERARRRMEAARDTKWYRAEFLAYRTEVADRDQGTGLFERGRFFADWASQIERLETSGQAASIIYVDMGFLKYFNNSGGRRVGDAALRKAAAIMEEALEVSGLNGAVYRPGGDEFCIRIEGGRRAAQAVAEVIAKLRAEAGAIPDLKALRAAIGDQEIIGESRPDYAPTELVFNVGIASNEDFNEILGDLREAGELDRLLAARNLTLSEFKAELLVKLADTSVNYEKAVSRFKILIDLINQPAYADQGSAYRARVEAIIKASQKAILAKMGGNEALQFFATLAGREDREILNKRIEDFVADRLEKIDELVNGEKELTDKFIELHAVRNRLLVEVSALSVALGDAHQRVIELRARLDEAEKARSELVAARGIVTHSQVSNAPLGVHLKN